MVSKSKYSTSTMIGVSIVGTPTPVFWDSHYAISQNYAPVSFISGSPGSGKTFLGLLLACHGNLMNKAQVILDPKGDFIALRKLYELGYINKVDIWNVAEANGKISDENIGMLDPTSFTNNIAENTALTMDILVALVGRIDDELQSTIIPIIKDVVEDVRPSFMSVANAMNRYRGDERVRSIGMTLQTYLQVGLGKLLSRDMRSAKKTQLDISNGTIVANLMGLTLPTSEKSFNDYSNSERISVAIMSLLTQKVINAMRSDKKIRKTLVIDEAWSIASTPKGKAMMSEVALLGRSLNMSVLLISQSPKHLNFGDNASLDNTITTRFAFRNNDERDNEMTVTAMRLEDPGWASILPELQPGTCLMKDCQGNAGIVQIMAPDGWAEIFDTNPNAVLETQK